MAGGAPQLHQHAAVGLGVVGGAHLGGGWGCKREGDEQWDAGRSGSRRGCWEASVHCMAASTVERRLCKWRIVAPHPTAETPGGRSTQGGAGSTPTPPPSCMHLEDLALHVKQRAGKGEGGAPLARPRLRGQLLHALLLVVPDWRVEGSRAGTSAEQLVGAVALSLSSPHACVWWAGVPLASPFHSPLHPKAGHRWSLGAHQACGTAVLGLWEPTGLTPSYCRAQGGGEAQRDDIGGSPRHIQTLKSAESAELQQQALAASTSAAQVQLHATHLVIDAGRGVQQLLQAASAVQRRGAAHVAGQG